MTDASLKTERPLDKTEPTPWEAAYLRFETPAEEVRKFRSRLIQFGADRWPRDARIVELFCGRGNGLRALHALGFVHVEGIDLSPALAERYEGPGTVLVGDCRNLPFGDSSRDVLIVQGGLHHLPELPQDLERTLAEAARVLKPGGRLVVVEPWLTPFLRVIHTLSSMRMVRAISGKMDAFAAMTEHETTTYFRWLGQPEVILGLLRRFFDMELEETGWGKLRCIGRKR